MEVRSDSDELPRFRYASFARLLPQRAPIIGEDPGSQRLFHDEMMQLLAPSNPYAFVLAANLVDLEWEAVQRRRLRDAALRKIIRHYLRDAVIAQYKAKFETRLEKSLAAHISNGKPIDSWIRPPFDDHAATVKADDIAERAISDDSDIQTAATEEIAALGLDPIDLLGKAYGVGHGMIELHNGKLTELERRRREVMREYNLAQAFVHIERLSS